MRAQRKKGGLKVYAVSGSHVVLLGIHLPEEECEGLLGFSVLREDHTKRETTQIGRASCRERV